MRVKDFRSFLLEHRSDDEMVPRDMVPDRVFHTTRKRNEASVRRDGVLPTTGGGSWLNRTYSPRVYVATSLIAAYDLTVGFQAHDEKHEDYVIFEIDTSMIPEHVFFEDEKFNHGIWTPEGIPASAIVGKAYASSLYGKFSDEDLEDLYSHVWHDYDPPVTEGSRMLRLYHGTNADPDTFELDPDLPWREAPGNTWDFDLPDGFLFLTDDPREAKAYGRNVIEFEADPRDVMTVRVDSENPSREFDEDYNYGSEHNIWSRFQDSTKSILAVAGHGKTTYVADFGAIRRAQPMTERAEMTDPGLELLTQTSSRFSQFTLLRDGEIVGDIRVEDGRVEGVVAAPGYGAMMYEIAMMHLYPLWVSPASGSTTDKAFEIWSRFDKRGDVESAYAGENRSDRSPQYDRLASMKFRMKPTESFGRLPRRELTDPDERMEVNKKAGAFFTARSREERGT